MPEKLRNKLATQPTDETPEAKLERALTLIAELKSANTIEEVKIKANAQQFI
jgi:hypothetical protein